MSPARAVAFNVLLRVLRGGYASDLLVEHSAELDSRDAGLAAQIVFGCLRHQTQLDFLIDHYAGKKAKTQPGVRVALWMGIYQIRYLDRIPLHAAVDESVELAKTAGGKFAGGFVNALLRKTNREPVRWPNQSIAQSCPAWLIERWRANFGPALAEGIARAALSEPETYIRWAAGESAVRHGAGGPALEPAEIPGAYRLVGGSVPPGARIQDIGSQSIVPLLDLSQGMTLLDLCSAPGNKTAQALETKVRAVACDLHLSRIQAMPVECPTVVLDATQPLPFDRRFDRILADVPCSGTGTLARNPEIKSRIQPTALAEFHKTQVSILRNALSALVPGGRMVYSTCSLEPEENQDVVKEVLAASAGIRLVHEMQRIPGREPGDGFYAAVLTSE